MNFKKILLSMVMLIGFAMNAQAGLIGVKTIEINNAIPTWLQVAEVVALDTNGLDVALLSEGATAHAPDTWSATSTPDKAIDGSTNGAFPNIFHEGADASWDTLTIVLGSVVELESIQIYGRTDCCQSRDLFNVSFFDQFGTQLYSAMSDSRNQASPLIQLPDTASVTEPGIMSLLTLGLVGLGLYRRKEKA